MFSRQASYCCRAGYSGINAATMNALYLCNLLQSLLSFLFSFMFTVLRPDMECIIQ